MSDVSVLPEKFFQVTDNGELCAYSNMDGRLIRDREPSPSAVPEDDGEERYWLVLPGTTCDELRVARVGTTTAFPLEVGHDLGFWTDNEKIARIAQAQLRRGAYLGVSQLAQLVEKGAVDLIRTFKKRK